MILLLLACKTPTPTVVPTPTPEGQGLLGDHPLNPFPVGALHHDGTRFTLESADFGISESQTPLPFERLDFRSGFSPGQTAVAVLDSLDTSALPHWSDADTQGSVRLFDLDTATFLPVFAEVDAHPQATPNTLLVRPLRAFPFGHEIAVVLTTDLTPRPPRFAAVLDGNPARELEPLASELVGIVDALETAGLARDEIALTWSFPVADGSAPTRSVWQQTSATAWNLDDVREEGAATAPQTFRAARGTFTTTEFLIDDTTLDLDLGTGEARPNGTVEAYLYVHVPQSVADAPAGTVPVMVFGHGIFATPDLYLDQADDPSSVARLCEEGGFIAVGTNWRGLTTPDVGGAIAVAQDFGRMHELTDRLVQSQANITGLIELLDDGAIFADPVFQGRSGQALPSDELVYYGISLGGIEGTVLQASDPPLDAAVLHVPGSTWSTMLERSSNWAQFELLLEVSIDDALARQRLYAVSQLWWDSVDPISFTPDLVDRDFLYQVSIGDEQVPNLTSYTLARSIDLPQIEPMVDAVPDLTAVAAGTTTKGMVQFDPETALPPDANRPAPVTDAHTRPRNFGGTTEQTRIYLQENRIEHPCGTTPCSTTNPEP